MEPKDSCGEQSLSSLHFSHHSCALKMLLSFSLLLFVFLYLSALNMTVNGALFFRPIDPEDLLLNFFGSLSGERISDRGITSFLVRPSLECWVTGKQRVDQSQDSEVHLGPTLIARGTGSHRQKVHPNRPGGRKLNLYDAFFMSSSLKNAVKESVSQISLGIEVLYWLFTPINKLRMVCFPVSAFWQMPPT